jgi:hypothetical protein
VTKLPEVPADFFALVKRRVGSAKDNERVELEAGWIRILLALAERAPQPRRRPKLTLQQKRQELWVLRQARARKAELMAQGMNAELAAEQAAAEFSPQLRNLSVSTIKVMMKRR